MKNPRALCLIGLLSSGCHEEYVCVDPTWSIPIVRAAMPAEGGDASAIIGPDGSIVLAIGDQDGVRFGDLQIAEPFFARVSADGVVGAVGHGSGIEGPVARGGGRLVGIDDARRPVAIWSSLAPYTMVGYDAAFQKRWQVGHVNGSISVGQGGEVAYFDSEYHQVLHLLAPDGTERWRVEGLDGGALRILPDGDVVVFVGATSILTARHVYRAADGMLLSQAPATGVLETIAADGGGIFYEGIDEDHFRLVRRRPDDTTVWEHRLVEPPLGFPAVRSFEGEVLVGTYREITRLDEETGATVGHLYQCGENYPIGTVAYGGVITVGSGAATSSLGLARFDE